MSFFWDELRNLTGGGGLIYFTYPGGRRPRLEYATEFFCLYKWLIVQVMNRSLESSRLLAVDLKVDLNCSSVQRQINSYKAVIYIINFFAHIYKRLWAKLAEIF